MGEFAIKKTLESSESYQILNTRGTAPILLICDHASAHIPASYHNLGLDADALNRHIAWDIGAGQLTKRLVDLLDATALLARFSRLLIDPNRAIDSPTLIPAESDGTKIPGNQGLSEADRAWRIGRYYQPFHAAIAAIIENFSANGVVPLVIGVHSFTAVMNHCPRPWHVGLLWDKDPRLAQALIKALSRRLGLVVGDNQPYSGRELYHTMTVHGAAHGFPQVTIEVRQDEIGTGAGVEKWARILAEELRASCVRTGSRTML